MNIVRAQKYDNPIVIEHSKHTKERNKYGYVQCDIINCNYKSDKVDWTVTCYGSAQVGQITKCSKWLQIDPFRLFIAIEREKRNERKECNMQTL